MNLSLSDELQQISKKMGM
ncbi:Protein of unknown function [Bacillus mycoides]|nr:Protein of unknown function [Bacillus mycoides]